MSVVEFKGPIKKKSVTPENALLEVLATKPVKLIVIGVSAERDLSFFSSTMPTCEMAWYMDQVKQALLMGVV